MEESFERQKTLLEEKRAMEELVFTLTRQNKEILEELESHAYTHEVVRTHLDRREEVAHMMQTFNRDLVESKTRLERFTGSPLRGHQQPTSPYRQSAIAAMGYQNYMVVENQRESKSAVASRKDAKHSLLSAKST